MVDKKQICLVEDDPELAYLVKEYLIKQAFDVYIVDNGNTAVASISQRQPDLVILDLMLPGKDGITICRELRPTFTGPILMLTASDEAIDQVLGLEIGADDFVNKPVEPRILLARIRALLRRVEQSGQVLSEQSGENQEVQENILHVGAIRLDKLNREVQINNQVIELNSQEYELLLLLLESAGQIISRDTLFKSLKGYEYDGQNRFIDVLISQLRHKLGDDQANLIKTVRGKGYLLTVKH